MKKVFWFFLTIGLSVLIAAFFVGKETYQFTQTALSTRGTVVQLERAEGQRSSNKKHSMSYYPVVTFADNEGQTITFRSNSGSNLPVHDVGDVVDVMYSPENSHDARINSVFSLWFLPMILLILGGIIFLVGLIPLLVMRRGEKRRRKMRERGERVLAQLSQVERNTSVKMNGQSPYRIVCQWFDPMEPSKFYTFKSENIWFNPGMFLKRNQQIEVYIDRKNPKKYYYVDITFLPEMA